MHLSRQLILIYYKYMMYNSLKFTACFEISNESKNETPPGKENPIFGTVRDLE